MKSTFILARTQRKVRCMIQRDDETLFSDLSCGFVVMKAFIDWHKKYIEWWKKKFTSTFILVNNKFALDTNLDKAL